MNWPKNVRQILGGLIRDSLPLLIILNQRYALYQASQVGCLHASVSRRHRLGVGILHVAVRALC